MLHGEHSAILSIIKLPVVIKIFFLSIFSGRFTQVYCNIKKQTPLKQYVTVFMILFDLIIYVISTIFQLHVNRDVSSWVEPVLS